MRTRVLIASPPMSAVGGVASHTRMLTRGLRGAVAFDQRWPVRSRPKSRIGRFGMHAFAGARWVGAILRRRPLVVHIQVTDTGVIRDAAYVWLARLCRAPIVSHVHSTGFFDSGTQSRDRALRYIVGLSDAVIVLSPRLRCRLAGNSGACADRISCLDNPVPPMDEPTVPGERSDGPMIRLLCVGEISEQKGQPHLTRVLRTINAHTPTACLELVGHWGALDDGDRRLIEKSPDVTVSGVLLGRDKTAAYDRADVFVLFSSREGQPLVILEAMSRGLPVIATDAGGIPEMLSSVSENVVVPVGSVDQLTSAIGHFAAQPSLRRQVGEANRVFVGAQCGVREHLLGLVDIYRRATLAHATTSCGTG